MASRDDKSVRVHNAVKRTRLSRPLPQLHRLRESDAAKCFRIESNDLGAVMVVIAAPVSDEAIEHVWVDASSLQANRRVLGHLAEDGLDRGDQLVACRLQCGTHDAMLTARWLKG